MHYHRDMDILVSISIVYHNQCFVGLFVLLFVCFGFSQVETEEASKQAGVENMHRHT